MYICLNEIEHMYFVTTDCMLRYAYMHVIGLKFRMHVYGWVGGCVCVFLIGLYAYTSKQKTGTCPYIHS
jgi:hypothetical protein